MTSSSCPRPDESNIILLNETIVELRIIVRGVEVVELDDRMRYGARALVIGEVTATLEEAIDDIIGGKDGEVVVVGEGDRVDEGGEEQVDNVFISEIRSELRLGVDLHKSDKGS